MEKEKRESAEEKEEASEETKKAYGKPSLTKFGPVEEFTGEFAS